MNTGNSEKCVHCSGTTEFVRRTKIRPERIPNLNDLNLNVPAQSTPRIRANGIILIVAVIITSLAVASSIFFAIKYRQLLSVRSDMEDVAELTEESIIPTEQQPLIYLFSNCDEQGENDSLTTIAVGENFPVLPDRENHTFSGWNTERDGTGMAFQAGDPFLIHIAEDLFLYAQWEIKPEETLPLEIVTENATIPEQAEEEMIDVKDGSTVQTIEPEETTTGLNNGVNTNE